MKLVPLLKKPVPVHKKTGTNPNCTKGKIELQHVYFDYRVLCIDILFFLEIV